MSRDRRAFAAVLPFVCCAVVAVAALALAPTAGAATNNIFTVAGTGTPGSTGDGGPASAAQVSLVFGLAITADGSVLISDQDKNRVRSVSPAGTITTVAGTGTFGFGGDGGPATAAQFGSPSGIALTAGGGYLIADTNNHRIRRVSPAGTITTAAGTGEGSFGGD